MHPDASVTKFDAAGRLFGAEPLSELINCQRGGDSSIRVVRLRVRRAEKREHGITDEFLHHATVIEGRRTHALEIVVANYGENLRLHGFAGCRKPGNIGEQY